MIIALSVLCLVNMALTIYVLLSCLKLKRALLQIVAPRLDSYEKTLNSLVKR